MFLMKVEKQMTLQNRTLLLGKPQFDEIPKQVNIKNEIINVIGISNGIVPPFMSLEVELVTIDTVGDVIAAVAEN